MGTVGEAARRNAFPTIGEVLFEDLRRRILSGEYKSGRKLVEGVVARQFGVSRTPVREAFRKLDLEGLVHYLPRRGVLVKGLSHEETAEIFVVLEVLQGLAARLVAQRITDRELKMLRGLHCSLSDAYRRRDFAHAVRLHTRFNRLLFAASRNRPLVRLLAQFDDYIEHTKMISVRQPGRATKVRREHEEMLAAIEARDPRAAAAAALRHVRAARQAFLQAVKRAESSG